MLRGAVGVLVVVAWLGPATVPTVGVADPVLTRRFTPASVAKGTYVAYRSDRPLQDIAARLSAEDRNPTPGAWKAERQDALDAFDGASRADRFRIVELYVGTRPLVARGSLLRNGRREAYTLISPYPDASLTRLEAGTLVILFHVPS